MMPNAITLLFKEARDAFHPLEGKPTDNDLLSIRETLLLILMEIPYDQLGGVHSLTAIITDGVRYAADHGGNAFKRPVHLPLYDGSIADDATTVIRVRAEAAQKARLDDYASFEAAERGAAKFLREVVDEVWYNDLKDADTFYTKVSALEIISFLDANSGGLHAMVNLVYCDDKNCLTNNYYFALSTTPASNPTQLPPSHTGIADSGASGFYFAPGAPMSNLDHTAPTVGVRVANSLPERSVASATLASAPSLPPAAMQGHVMPTFPHTLIGLGPFADLGCTIVFTKTAVSVIHPDGHSILEGWRELDGPRLWRFPLNAIKPSLSVPALHENYEAPPTRQRCRFFQTTSLQPN